MKDRDKVEEDSRSEAEKEASIAVHGADAPVIPATQSKWYEWRKAGTALVSYLLDSEVHTYAFSVAANAILSFIPFIVLLYTLTIVVFHSQVMKGVVDDMVNYYLPSATKDPKWVVDNIVNEAVLPLMKRHGVQAFSLVMILISCTGIFLPLEVALNQAWGVTKSRNYLHNQVIAFGLAVLMVVLGMGSVLLNAGARNVLKFILIHDTSITFIDNILHITYQGTSYILLAATTGIAMILFLFSIYLLLPNRKVPWRPVLRTSIYTGVIWLAAKYAFGMAIPHLGLIDLYGPFYVSVGLLFWAYISGLILFAGAQFSVARWGQKRESAKDAK